MTNIALTDIALGAVLPLMILVVMIVTARIVFGLIRSIRGGLKDELINELNETYEFKNKLNVKEEDIIR